MSTNLVVLEGSLNAEPEMKTTTGGKTLANFELAVPNYQKDSFIFKVTAWGDLAEQIRNLPQGTKLTVYGRMTQRKYEWQGAQKTANDIVANSIDVRVQKTDSRFETKQVSKPQPTQEFDDSQIPF